MPLRPHAHGRPANGPVISSSGGDGHRNRREDAQGVECDAIGGRPGCPNPGAGRCCECWCARGCEPGAGFGRPVDLEDENVRAFLANPINQTGSRCFLGRKLGELTTEKRPLEVESSPILLSQTPPFHWRRHHTVFGGKTVFNYVATFNPFETQSPSSCRSART